MRSPISRLVGREAEVAAAGELLATARCGAGVVLLIDGEAGIGKTRLIESLIAQAHYDGLSVLRGGAHPLERTRPFGAMVEALDLRPRSMDSRRAAIGRLPERGRQSGGSI